MAIKIPPRTKLATSSQISEKPISSTFVLLMKHSHENHIVMVPLRILMRFFIDFHVRTFKCQRIYQKNCSTTLVSLRWRHGSWTLYEQGNQRWQIPLPATCQCLVTFTPLKAKHLIFFRDVISLLARVFILLIDRATQEVPMKNIWKKLSVQFLRYAIELLHVKRHTRHKWR